MELNTWKQYLLEHTVLEDKYKIQELINKGIDIELQALECYNCGENQYFYIISEYGKRIVTCPACGTKYIVELGKGFNMEILGNRPAKMVKSCSAIRFFPTVNLNKETEYITKYIMQHIGNQKEEQISFL